MEDMGVLSCWPSTMGETGEVEQHLPGTDAGAGLLARLERMWNFIRLRLHHHFTMQSGAWAARARLAVVPTLSPLL